MPPIQMVDLRRQYLRLKDQIDTAMNEVLESTQFIGGPVVERFAQHFQEYLGVRHVITCANGTDAIQIALMALGLQPGDEVITPSFTFIATVEVVALLGLTPVFVDVDPDNFNILPSAIEAAITPKTKAIIPVHLYGQSAPMHEILEIAQRHNLYVVEDTAQAIGGYYTFPDGRKAMNGTMGTIGTTSFFPSKNLGCYGDGGAVFTNDAELAKKLKMIANHGQSVRYIHDMVGLNSRLDALQAAVLDVKLKYLDEFCQARRKVADAYDKAFAKHPYINTPFRAPYSYHVFHQYTLTLDPKINRDHVVAELGKRGIPSMIYYPIPCHRQKMFEGKPVVIKDLSTTERLNPSVISLPIHTEFTQEELDFIISNTLEVVEFLSK